MPVTIHRFSAPPDKFFVNSFIVETDSGLVLVDTQFLVSTARELADRVAAIGKPLEAVIVTHPHPDHYNGLPLVLDRAGRIPVYATVPTIEGIRATQAEKRGAWTPVYGDDYPMRDALPDHAVGADETLTLAGTEIRLLDLGPGECADNTILHLPEADALIASDLIYNGCHPWLAEHRTGAWLRQLDEVETSFSGVGRVFAGHGAEGGVELFDLMRRYIAEFRTAVGREARTGALSAAALERIAAGTVGARPGWPLEALVEMNANAVAQELAAE